MASLDKVPIVEVNTENLVSLWPAILQAIRSATFIAIDTELSGLGDRKLLNARVVDERYKHMCEVAKTRSMVALGISCFKLLQGDERADNKDHQFRKLHFQVQTYNIMLLCSEHYVVEPGSLRFLVEHGFDFNLQYAKGLPYKRGNDKDGDLKQSVRNIFTEIIRSEAAVVLHNALVDLVFLYGSLYATLPASQQSFITDLAEMFPGGLFDTKYITDFKARMGASYLEYVFKRCQRDNVHSKERCWSHILVSFPKYQPSKYIISMPCSLSIGQHSDTDKDSVCMQYANHGWCPSRSTCTKCHDINIILDIQDRGKSVRKHLTRDQSQDRGKSVRKHLTRDQSHESGDCTNSEEICESSSWTSPIHSDMSMDSSDNSDGHNPDRSPSASVNKAGSHRAGFDGFMTGFIFAFFSARYGKNVGSEDFGCSGELGMDEYKNKLYLVGKDIPLQVTPSSFSKPSKAHLAKIAKVRLR